MEEIDISATTGGRDRRGRGMCLWRMGEGAPLIFSHGAGFACASFSALTARLARSFCVYLLDLPGHGTNAPVDEARFSLDDALDVMRAACVEVARRHEGRAPALVCHSISGVLALRLRAEDTRVMSALVAYEPPLAQPDASSAISIADQAQLERRALGRRRTFQRIEDLAERFAAQSAGIGLSASAAFEVAAGLLKAAEHGGFELRCAPEVEAKIYRTNQNFGLWTRLRDSVAPVTIMAGRRTLARDYPGDVAVQIAEAGGFNLLVLSGLSHLGWAEAPDRAASLISAILGSEI